MPASKTPTKKKVPARRAKKPVARRVVTKRKVSSVRRVKKLETNEPTRDPFAFLSAADPEPVLPETPAPVSLVPALDLDALAIPAEPAPVETPAPGEEITLSWRSRLSFYLGVFFGAIVVHVLVVALLAIVSV